MIRRTRGAGPKNLRRRSISDLDLQDQDPTSTTSDDHASPSTSTSVGTSVGGIQSVTDGDIQLESPVIKIKRSSTSNARKSAALRSVSASSSASASNPASKLRSVSTPAPAPAPATPAASSSDDTASSTLGDSSPQQHQQPPPAVDRDPFASRRRRLGESPFSSASSPRADDANSATSAHVLKPGSSATDLASLAAHYASEALSSSSPAPDFIAIDGTTISRDARRSALTTEVTTLAESDPDASDDSDGEDQDMMRQWELDQIRRGGALQTTSGLAAHAARAMHEIAREGDGRLPMLPPIPPLADTLASLTSTLSSLDLAHASDSAAHVAALAAEHDRLVAADSAADADLHDLSLTLSLTRNLRDHIQDALEWAADVDPQLTAWELDLVQDFAGTRDRIVAEAQRMLDDVRDDVRDAARVLAPLHALKARDPVGYRRALAHEVVPLVVATHVRCDLMAWDPVGEGGAIEARAWHLPVTMYGLPAGGAAGGLNPNDPDAGLYRKLVVGYVVPVLEARIRSAGNGLAEGGAGVRVVDALEEVLYVVDKGEAAFQKLVLAALDLCEQTCTSLANPQDWHLDLISAVSNLSSLLVRLDKYAITSTPASGSTFAFAAFAPPPTHPDHASLSATMRAHLSRTHAALLTAAAHVLATCAASAATHAGARTLVKLVVDSTAGVYLRPRALAPAGAPAAAAAVGPVVFATRSDALPLPPLPTLAVVDDQVAASLRAAVCALARHDAWPMTGAQVEGVSKWVAEEQAGDWTEVVGGLRGRRVV